MFHFNTPWKRQNVFGFMTFSGGTKIEGCVLKWVDILKTSQRVFDLPVPTGQLPVQNYQ